MGSECERRNIVQAFGISVFAARRALFFNGGRIAKMSEPVSARVSRAGLQSTAAADSRAITQGVTRGTRAPRKKSLTGNSKHK
jgi:hypothetical protein